MDNPDGKIRVGLIGTSDTHRPISAEVRDQVAAEMTELAHAEARVTPIDQEKLMCRGNAGSEAGLRVFLEDSDAEDPPGDLKVFSDPANEATTIEELFLGDSAGEEPKKPLRLLVLGHAGNGRAMEAAYRIAAAKGIDAIVVVHNPSESVVAKLHELALEQQVVEILDTRDLVLAEEVFELTCSPPLDGMECSDKRKRKYRNDSTSPRRAFDKQHRGGAW